MKKMLLAFVAVFGLAFAAPAFAEDIDVVIGSAAWNVDQTAVSIAVSTATASADAVNIAGLTTFDGLNTDDLLAGSVAYNVDQLAVAGSLALGCGVCGEGDATADATNIAGAVIVDVKEVMSESSDTVAVALAGNVTQEAWSVALGAGTAAAASTNIAGLVSVSIDVD